MKAVMKAVNGEWWKAIKIVNSERKGKKKAEGKRQKVKSEKR